MAHNSGTLGATLLLIFAGILLLFGGALALGAFFIFGLTGWWTVAITVTPFVLGWLFLASC